MLFWLRGSILPSLIFLLALQAWGQKDKTPTGANSKSGTEPVTAAQPYYSDGASPVTDGGSSVVPDEHPLGGIQRLTLGIMPEGRNYVTPSLSFYESLDSNPLQANGGNSWQPVESLTGKLDLQRTGATRSVGLHYTGGASFYHQQTQSNYTFHSLGADQSFSFGRWVLSLSDQFSYSPQSPLYGGAGNFAPLGGLNFNVLDPSLIPNQNVLTSNSSRISNTSAGQLQYRLSPTSSITGSASYGVLRFNDTSLFDSSQFQLSGGYNKQLSAWNTIGLSYSYGDIWYPSSTSEFLTHTIQASYGRRLAGRLMLQLSGGPLIYQQKSLSATKTNTGWSGQAGLQYQRGLTHLGLSYLRSFGAGSGVFVGGTSDTTQLTVSRTIAKVWSTSTNAGYSRTSGLIGGRYNTGSFGAQVGRNITQTTQLSLSYQFQRQNSESVICVTIPCSNDLLRHVVTLGFTWQHRPISLAR